MFDDFRSESFIRVLHVTDFTGFALCDDGGRQRLSANRIQPLRRVVPQLRLRGDVVTARFVCDWRRAKKSSAKIALAGRDRWLDVVGRRRDGLSERARDESERTHQRSEKITGHKAAAIYQQQASRQRR